MAKVRVYAHAMNVGVQDQRVLTRIDLERMRLAAEDQTNLLATTTGRAFLRPGLGYLGQTSGSQTARFKEFVYSGTEAALMEFTSGVMRIWVDDALVTRPAVSATVASGDFSASTGWTNISTDGASAVVGSGYLALTATGRGSLAGYKQQVSTSSAGVEHALRITLLRGSVVFRCGSTDGGDEYIAETTLGQGVHSLAFTPSGAFWVQLQTTSEIGCYIDAVQVEAAGVLTFGTQWTDPAKLRFAQSADVIYAAYEDIPQYKIERRSNRSWSLANYVPADGPFSVARTAPVRLKCNALNGIGTLTSDKPFFQSGHVGALFRLFHTGQNNIAFLAGEGQYTDPFEVTGINGSDVNDRYWEYAISGTWVGTLRVKRSFDGPDYGYKSYKKNSAAAIDAFDITSNTGSNENNTDDDDNAIVYYKIGFDPGAYTSGSAQVSILYSGGGDYGICRVIGYTSSTSVTVEILRPFTSYEYTEDWREGEWSMVRGYPSAVAFSEGRLWWGGLDRFWGSVSDAFESFDEDIEGDSGPILRSIATGGISRVKSIVPLQRMLILTDSAETTAKSSSFDEPLTPTNTTLRNSSTIGCSGVDVVRTDSRAMFVDRAGRGLFELVYSIEQGDYASAEVSKLAASYFLPGIRSLAIQRRPETRVWVTMEDGSAMCIVYEPQQEVVCFVPVETDGAFEGVAVIPGAGQDSVYFCIARSINGTTVRHLEKMAADTDAYPGNVAKVMDAFVSGTNSSPSATISGLGHLIGESVKVWADGAPITETVAGYTNPKLFTVSAGGTITLDAPVTDYCVGLPYRGRFKSARLAYGAAGSPMLQRKKVNGIGMVLTQYVRSGIRYGGAFDDPYHALDPLPQLKDYQTAAEVVGEVVTDEHMFNFDGQWNIDSRVCLEVNWPATILGLVYEVDTNE